MTLREIYTLQYPILTKGADRVRTNSISIALRNVDGVSLFKVQRWIIKMDH